MQDALVTRAKPIRFLSAAWHLSSKETSKQCPIFEVSVSEGAKFQWEPEKTTTTRGPEGLIAAARDLRAPANGAGYQSPAAKR